MTHLDELMAVVADLDERAAAAIRPIVGVLAHDPTLLDGLADDVAWYQVGEPPVGGAHRGPEALASLDETIHRWTGGSLRLVDLAVLQDEVYVAAMFRAEATHGDRNLRGYETVFALTQGSHPRRFYHFVSDPAGHASFWAP